MSAGPDNTPMVVSQREAPCSVCRAAYRISDMHYRLGVDGMPFYRCEICDEAAEKQITANMRAKEEREADEKAVDQAKRHLVKTINAVHISEIDEDMMELYGGHKQFARFWYGEIMEEAARAASTNGSRRTVLDACNKIVNLIAESSRQRQTAPDVDDLNDRQIEIEVRQILQMSDQRAK